MCIIITAPAGNTIPEDHLKNGFDGNDDGAGIAIAVNGKLEVNKFLKYEDFIDYYRTVAGKYPTVVHFRIGTQGTKDTTNVHPFMIHDIAMFHNGVFHHKDLKHSLKSDTSMLADILNGLPENWFNNDAIMHLLDAYCGYNSKLVFITGDGEIKILNEIAGEWLEGRWYSNTSYKFRKKYTSTFNSYGYTGKYYPPASTLGYNYGGKTNRSNWNNNSRPSSIMGTSKFDLDEDDTEFGYWFNESYKNPKDEILDDSPVEEDFTCNCCEMEMPHEDMINWNGYPICIDCLELIGADTVDATIEYKNKKTTEEA